MFRKSKNKSKDKSESSHQRGNPVGDSLAAEFKTAKLSKTNVDLINFYEKLYQSKTANPYWQKIHADAQKNLNAETLDFFEAYLELLKNPTKEEWQQFYSRWIEAENLSSHEAGINIVSKTRSLLAKLNASINAGESDIDIDFSSIRVLPDIVGSRPSQSSSSSSSRDESSSEELSSSSSASAVWERVVKNFSGKEIIEMTVREVLQLFSADKESEIIKALKSPQENLIKEDKGKEKSKSKGKGKDKDVNKEPKHDKDDESRTSYKL